MADRGSKRDAGSLFRVMLTCNLGAVRQAALSAREVLASQGAAEEDLSACELALVEACNNAILYVSNSGRQEPIEIQLLSAGPDLEIHVIDHTSGFEWPGQLALPDTEAEHGRGLFIIQSLMDEVLYLRGQNENHLIMRKSLMFWNADATLISAEL